MNVPHTSAVALVNSLNLSAGKYRSLPCPGDHCEGKQNIFPASLIPCTRHFPAGDGSLNVPSSAPLHLLTKAIF
ncbi:hypothetical protein E2C01_068272 [Portunus trituberculatus]|uniref:Uncharacterized protein n=1 Tax=Portunus trituberculatus TaxID=210409 RepID=A0A5B7HW26_PORTR|nr:hypothetical protein [Portunus trituberculatus]